MPRRINVKSDILDFWVPEFLGQSQNPEIQFLNLIRLQKHNKSKALEVSECLKTRKKKKKKKHTHTHIAMAFPAVKTAKGW